MNASQQEIQAVLNEFNPWWSGEGMPQIPAWERPLLANITKRVGDRSTKRALVLNGARQTGKTTLLLQAIRSLLDKGVAPSQILYVSFDHPVLKFEGVDVILKAWREIQPTAGKETEYLFLDEIQSQADWQVWMKLQVDFSPFRRIVATGSAVTLATDKVESGVGRWSRVPIPSLSFREYLDLQGITVPGLMDLDLLEGLEGLSEGDRIKLQKTAQPLVGYFNEYLIKSGFPGIALLDDVAEAQTELREDIVNRVLMKDLTTLFGVRKPAELERLFVYLCLHDGGILDLLGLSRELGVSRETVAGYLDFFEAGYLLRRLQPYGQGKQVLRGQSKGYLSDPAISGAVLMKGRNLIADSVRLGTTVESAVTKHVMDRYARQYCRFSYWRSPRGFEVDLIAEFPEEAVPFEVKYQSGGVDSGDLKGLKYLLKQKKMARAFVITRGMDDFGADEWDTGTMVYRVPAPLACYWLSPQRGAG